MLRSHEKIEPDSKFKRGFVPKWTKETFDVTYVKGRTIYIDGKRHRINNVQVVRTKEQLVGKKYDEAIKEDRVKRKMNKEGIEINNIATPRITRSTNKKEIVTWDKSLIGRKVKKEKREGVITKYDPEGPYKWFVEFGNGDSEFMSKGELLKYFV